jgi:hypothetical protein
MNLLERARMAARQPDIVGAPLVFVGACAAALV